MTSFWLKDFTKREEFPFYIHYGKHDKSMKMHDHKDFIELTIVLAGEAVHVVGEERFSICQGDVFAIHTNTVHGFEEATDFRICNIMFRRDFFQIWRTDIGRSAGFQALFYVEPELSQNRHFASMLSLDQAAYGRVKDILQQMVEEYQEQKQSYQTMVCSLFLVLVTELSRAYPVKQVMGNKELMALASSAAWMEENFNQKLKVEELARIAGYSSRHFSRLFRDTFHVSPMEYLMKLRIEYACQLLQENRMTVMEISENCGFENMTYFYRVFQKKMNMTPAKYRKMHSCAENR